MTASRLCGLLAASFLTTVSAGTLTAQDAVKRGEDLVSSEKCLMCHSVAGKGTRKYPLDGVGGRLSEADIREWLVNPDTMQSRKGDKPLMKMPSYKSLSAEELDALVAYLASLK